MRGIWLLLVAFIAAAPGLNARAAGVQNYQLSLLLSDEPTPYREAVEKLQRHFPGVELHATWPPASPGVARLVLALGPGALRMAANRMAEGDVTVALFSSREVFRQARGGGRPAGELTAIFADPDPLHQFRLIRRLARRGDTVGVLISEESVYTVAELEQAALREGMSLAIERVGAANPLGEALQRLSPFPVLLALPDMAIYRPEAIRSILLASYRRRQFLIGYSAAMVRAGALATAVSNVDDILAQLEETVRETDRSRRAPAPQFPRYFSVLVNTDVARSLGIVTDDAAALSSTPGGGAP